MDILKIIYYIIAYTMQFFLWLVIGRVAVLIIGGGRRNVLVDFFINFTQPIYNFVQTIFPFIRVPEEKRNSGWGVIDGMVPFVAIIFIWLLEKIIRIIISVIIVNMSA